MNTVWISTKGQIVLPVSVRRALGLKPGMRVNVEVDGKSARLTSASASASESESASASASASGSESESASESASAPAKKTVTLTEIQALLQYKGAVVAVATMRAAHHKS